MNYSKIKQNLDILKYIAPSTYMSLEIKVMNDRHIYQPKIATKCLLRCIIEKQPTARSKI